MESWRGNVVSCDGCPNPPTTNAIGGSWHAGTHIIHTIDRDDPGEGGGTTSSVAKTSSTSQQPTSASSAKPPAKTTASATSSAPPARTSKADGDDGDDGDSDDEDSGKGKGKGGGKVRRSSFVKALTFSVVSILTLATHSWRKRYLSSRQGQKAVASAETSNAFQTQGNDEDDAGFSDPPVTATVTFTGKNNKGLELRYRCQICFQGFRFNSTQLYPSYLRHRRQHRQ